MAIDARASLSRTKTLPIPVVRSSRVMDLRVLTSLPAGKMVPLAAFGLLREDQVGSSRVRLNFEMMETVEILMNPINVRVMAYLVPNLAFDRFDGIDALNRSYQKQPKNADVGATVVPYFQSAAFARASNEILTYMGKHAREGQMVNTAYVEAYNTIWNYRVANRSPDIAHRLLTDTTLAKAFWSHQRFAAIVPDFDQAVIDGEVPLNVVNSAMPVTGLGFVANTVTPMPSLNIYESKAAAATAGPGYLVASQQETPAANQQRLGVRAAAATAGALPKIFAELAGNGITVSLSNIELARKTQAFAALRKQYTGHSDDYIIDLLMGGITVPEQAWRQPILLADKSTIFGMSKRFASDSVDLTASVVNGATTVDLSLVTPRCPTGGVVMIVAEITPEQLFERSQDPYLHTLDQDKLPEFLRDTLDPEKVEVVPNEYIDLDHDVPLGTFGYAPLNFKWNMQPPGIGGKFYRPTVDAAFDEDRQRIWAVETQNPTLSEDFYLCTNMHLKPFVVTDADPFEAVARGVIAISGNTVFGNVLVEATDDYETVMAEAPQDRIVKPATTVADDEVAS